jgi:hypothetical protein
MFWKRKKRTHRYYRKTKRTKVNFFTKLLSKFLWVTIAFLVILLVICVFSFFRKLSQPEASDFGSSGKVAGKQITARIQIFNGCSRSKGNEYIQKIIRKLEQLKSEQIGYEIVESGKCDFGSMELEDSLVNESMILDRTGNGKDSIPSEAAIITARVLGIKPHNGIYKKLKNNYQDITLTLLVGNDYKTLISGASP